MRGSVAGLSVAIIALTYPPSAYAQTPALRDSAKPTAPKESAKAPVAKDSAITPATKDLIGKWEGIVGVDPKTERGADGKPTTFHSIVLRPNGHWDEWYQGDQGEGCIGGTWRVVADTALFMLEDQELSYKIAMTKNTFRLFTWEDTSSPSEAYQRVDSAVKPVPPHIARLDQCTKDRTGQAPPPMP